LDRPQELLTIRDFIRWGASRFNAAGLWFGHGTSNALDEAAQLVLHVLYLQPRLPDVYLDSRLTTMECDEVVALLQRRIEERIPAAYLTHRAWFAGLEFYVNDDVLVPRSPIAELIEARFEPWVDPEGVTSILDLCTGSGCIGIAAAIHLPGAMVDLADISEAALAVAQENIEHHGLEQRVRPIHSDLFDALGDQRYDIIVSNPPYVSVVELAALPREYAWEPRLGLDGGVSGLDFVQRILRDARQHLNPEGVLIVEVGSSAAALEEAFPGVPFLWPGFERGGEGVFLLTARQLQDCEDIFRD
jgi:ribosomal protein L3 glutamine methyltransferase